jgi:hypothetical protein
MSPQVPGLMGSGGCRELAGTEPTGLEGPLTKRDWGSGHRSEDRDGTNGEDGEAGCEATDSGTAPADRRWGRRGAVRERRDRSFGGMDANQGSDMGPTCLDTFVARCPLLGEAGAGDQGRREDGEAAVAPDHGDVRWQEAAQGILHYEPLSALGTAQLTLPMRLGGMEFRSPTALQLLGHRSWWLWC